MYKDILILIFVCLLAYETSGVSDTLKMTWSSCTEPYSSSLDPLQNEKNIELPNAEATAKAQGALNSFDWAKDHYYLSATDGIKEAKTADNKQDKIYYYVFELKNVRSPDETNCTICIREPQPKDKNLEITRTIECKSISRSYQ